MQADSFDNAFYEEISKFPVPYAMPVFFGESPLTTTTANLNSATATLLALNGRFLGVTCWHVLDAYRRFNVAKVPTFSIGSLQLDPDKHIVSENSVLDLVILDLTQFLGSNLPESRFFDPPTWPPGDVSEDDTLCLAGFPGVWREQPNIGRLRFYSFSSGAGEVTSVRDTVIVTRLQLDECITVLDEGKVLGSVCGLSGGPVFVWRKGPVVVAELVGFIFEYSEAFDLMQIRRANVIGSNGVIL